MSAPITAFPIPTTDFYLTLDRRPNAVAPPFNADPTGVVDSTAAIQAAINFAAANNLKEVYLPNGSYKITSTLRLGPTNTAAMSMTLLGAEGPGNHEGYGTRLLPTFNNDVALAIEGGQGMMVKNISIIGPGGGYRGNQNANGVGIGIVNNGAGSRCTIENCEVLNFYTGYTTQIAGGGALGDSNTFIKCIALNCQTGYDIPSNQNFINSFYDCMAATTVGINCLNGGSAHVFGGNWSTTNAEAAAFAISGISALSSVAHGNGFVWSFTAQVTAPNSFWPNVYNVFTFATTHFGIVPAELTNWNAGTNTGTFQILYEWSTMVFGKKNIVADTNFQAELQAATKVYAVEYVTHFLGYDMSIIGIHIEDDNAPGMLVDTFLGFGDQRPSMIENVFYNTDPSFRNYRPSTAPTDANLARYYAAQTFPFVRVRGGDLTIRNSRMGVVAPGTVNIDFQSTGFLKIENCAAFNVNLRNPSGTGAVLAQWDEQAQYWAGGVMENNYLTPCPSSVSGIYCDTWLQNNRGNTRFWGYRPSPNEVPLILVTDMATLQGALPAISEISVNYPLMYGGQIYQLYGIGDNLADQPYYTFLSTHRGWSYGQDLTVANIPGLSWSYQGQSAFVYCNHIGLIRGGMGVILNDGVNDILYIVTGVWADLGFFTVAKATNLPTLELLSGGKLAVITGTTIKQEPFVITQMSELNAANARVASQFDKTTDTNLANIPGLTANLYIGKTYKFNAVLFCTCNAGGGAQVQVGGTAGLVFLHYGAKTYTGAVLSAQNQATAPGVAVGQSTSAVDLIEIEGVVGVNPNPGNAGTFTIQFAQNAAVGTSSVLTGSTFEVRGLP